MKEAAAPYNPETLALMRRESHRGPFAVASMLGWPPDRVVSIARKHDIELAGAVIAPQVISPPLVPVPQPAPTRDSVLFDAETGIVTTLRGKAKLSKRQAQVFEYLWRQRQKTSGSVIASAVGVTIYNVSAIASILNGKLLRIGLKIETASGHRGGGGGYRLASENGVMLP